MFRHPFLMYFPTGRRTGCRLTGTIRLLRGGRFLMGLVPLCCARFVCRCVPLHRRRVRPGGISVGLLVGCLRVFGTLLFLLSW